MSEDQDWLKLHFVHSSVKSIRLSERTCFIIWISYGCNLKERIFMRLMQRLVLKHSEPSSRNFLLKMSKLRMKEIKVKAIKETEKQLNEAILHEHEIEQSLKLQSKDVHINTVNALNMQEGKVDTCKALDAGLVITERSGTESGKQDTSSRSQNDTNAVNADIRSVYDKEPMAEVQLTTKHNVLANGKQHVELPEFNNEGKVDSYRKVIRFLHEQGTLNFDTSTSYKDKQDNLRVWLLKMLMSKNQVLGYLVSTIFDEYFQPPPSVVSHVVPAAVPLPNDTSGTPLLTTIDQDAPSASTSPTTKETQAPVINQGVEEKIQGNQNAQFDNDPFINNLTPEPNSEESSSRDVIPLNLHQVNQPFDHLKK
ncbi:hypothetical protein Tco_0060015 [Tanacetum coccineum]